ncbi:uncharacterized protein [Nicotiana sylvestris]|uniref:uncharacterized protein n=1 Tax=Nicotiana sylvestris TaxID=4096 RepID=UPI00388C6CFD
MGSLAYILVGERLLISDVHSLDNQFVSLDISEPSQVVSCIVSQSSLYEHIRERKYDDPHLLLLKDTVWYNGVKQVTIGDYGVLRMGGQIYVPNVDGLHELIIEEVHNSCLVKYEHQRHGSLLQRLEILEWNWEHITMDFLVGLSQTSKKFDVVWIIVERLTKSAHFIPVVVTYSSKLLVEIYIGNIVRLHGVPMSIIYNQGT